MGTNFGLKYLNIRNFIFLIIVQKFEYFFLKVVFLTLDVGASVRS